jgi:dolichol-phosphate mannosyltransferase
LSASTTNPAGQDGKTIVKTLSIAAPAYNEGAGIERVVADWLTYLRTVSHLESFEIVVCNDGSRDNTGALLDGMAASNPELKPVHLPQNQGAAAALTQAIKSTAKDWVLLIDSDGQFPIENLAAMVAAIGTSGKPAAIGVRQKKDTAFARFGTWSSGALCNLFHGTHYRDFNSAFKLVAGPLMRSVTLEAKGLNYSTEITSRLLERGAEMVEVEIEHRPRIAGTSSMRLVRGSIHRFMFVFYIGVRQLLLRMQILQRPSS